MNFFDLLLFLREVVFGTRSKEIKINKQEHLFEQSNIIEVNSLFDSNSELLSNVA